ncbi:MULTISPECIES: transposase [unclassified Brevibacterium]|uniref:transposase n=1 Tax=unclassified Brevibacterium TaxID=2614124 RepID=UPI001092D785|nr:transposase [Brevibacterium sp. S22]TGD26727.1 hypothetical protein EB835_19520 [Brevibacterium sp. S22]
MARPSKYSQSLREQLVRSVVADGEIVSEVARRHGVNPETLRQWVKKHRAENPITETPLGEADREELDRLRREVRDLRMEREFLKKAAAFFAKEQP